MSSRGSVRLLLAAATLAGTGVFAGADARPRFLDFFTRPAPPKIDVTAGLPATPPPPKTMLTPVGPAVVRLPPLGTMPLVDLVDPQTFAMVRALSVLAHDPTANKRDLAGIAAYYKSNGYAPVWVDKGAYSDHAKALIARLGQADTDGLDPGVYAIPSPDFGKSGSPDVFARANADAMLSRSIVAYTRDAYAGRVVPASVSNNIGYEQHLPDPIYALRSVVLASDPVETMVAYNPPQDEFAALRKLLADVRAKAAAEKVVVIPAGPNLKPGMRDQRVPLLRERFELPAYVEKLSWLPKPSAELVYDAQLADAVKAFQKSINAKPDGVIGKTTIAALNQHDDHIGTVIANMEKWRWAPRYFGRYYVRVNIPDFTLEVHKDGQVTHTTRIIVGKVDLQTPIFSDEIEHVIVNPAWNVPASIIAKEYLPSLRSGGYPKGFDVFAKVGGRFKAVDPGEIDWSSVSANDIQLRQPPGERNALGVVKFMFPNKYAVYLHDTPTKNLFQSSYRAYSHGCMRVMDPWAFADSILTEEGWDSARLKQLVGGPEKRVDLREHIYVHITYFTAWVDSDGTPQFRPDLYGHDKRIIQVLGLNQPDQG